MSNRATFFVDRCLGKGVATALQVAGANVEIHDNHFTQDAKDEDWIPQVAQRGWIILTKDKNIRRRLTEREALLTSNARVFTLSSGNMRGTEMAQLFVSRLAEMEAMASSQPAPFVNVVAHTGIQQVWRAPDVEEDDISDDLPPESPTAS